MTLLGQINDNSPYSRYGIGDLADNNFNHTRQMAGLGSSWIDGYHINIVNPASYSFLNAAAFDIGVFAKRTFLEDKFSQNKIWTGNLEYISLAFPLRNPINDIYDGIKKKYKLGMAITLMPHSYVNYNIASNDTLANFGAVSRTYIGTGGTYKVLWGNSIKYKDFSVGLNMGYLFGKISGERNLFFDDLAFAYSDQLSSSYNVKGFLWNVGGIYSKVLNQDRINANKLTPSKRIVIGLNANSATGFSTNGTIDEQLVQSLLGGGVNRDTIQFGTTTGRGRLPAELGVGFTYFKGEKTAIGINLSNTFWSSYFNDANDEQAGIFKNSMKLGVGGYIRPNYKSFDNFFKRVFYRYGVYYNTDPRVIDGNQLQTYGVTMGLGMPFVYQRKISHVNLGINMGMRGQNTPISEKFVKISLGVTFNDDEWFLKRKYN